MSTRRADLRNMDAYPGEHYPVEQRVVLGVRHDDGTLELTGERRQIQCACTDDLLHPWPHR